MCILWGRSKRGGWTYKPDQVALTFSSAWLHFRWPSLCPTCLTSFALRPLQNADGHTAEILLLLFLRVFILENFSLYIIENLAIRGCICILFIVPFSIHLSFSFFLFLFLTFFKKSFFPISSFHFSLTLLCLFFWLLFLPLVDIST